MLMTGNLISHTRLKFFGLIYHLLDFNLGGHTAAQMLLLIDLGHLGGEIGSYAVTQFFYGIDT